MLFLILYLPYIIKKHCDENFKKIQVAYLVDVFKDAIKKYSKNLDVIDEHSFFNVDNQLFCVKFPVPSAIYEVINIYNLSTTLKKRIVIHISDKTDISIGSRKKDSMLTGIFNLKEIIELGNPDLSLNEKSSLTVLVYNDNLKFDPSKISDSDFEKLENKSVAFLPNDKGGGVIIVGP